MFYIDSAWKSLSNHVSARKMNKIHAETPEKHLFRLQWFPTTFALRTVLGEPAILCPDQTLIGKQGNWLEIQTPRTVQTTGA